MPKWGIKKNFLNVEYRRKFLGCIVILVLACGASSLLKIGNVSEFNNPASMKNGVVETKFGERLAPPQASLPLAVEALPSRKGSVSALMASPEYLENHNFLTEAYPNMLNPATVNFDNKGLYFGIDGTIAKFTELKERRSTYTEVVRNCGGSNPEQTNQRRDIGSDVNSPFLHPRWSGGLALGPLSAQDSTVTAYTSTYGDGTSPVYRNYRIYNGGSSIFELKDFRPEASKGLKSASGGAAVDSSGQYWRQSGSFGRDLAFFQQNRTTGAFNRYAGIKSSIPGDTEWDISRVTSSFEFDYEDRLYILVFNEAKKALWLYTLDTTDKRNIKAIQRKLITGELADKGVLFDKGNNSQTNGLVWWEDYWWIMRQDTKAGNPNSNDNPNAAIYRIDPQSNESIRWVKGVTVHEGKNSCWDRSWVGGLGSVERIPKNPGAKLDVDIKADKAVVGRGESVKYTVSVENKGWNSYVGEVKVDFADVLKNADRVGEVTIDDSGQERRRWTAGADGMLEWAGLMHPYSAKMTINFVVRIKERALDGVSLTGKVLTDPGRTSTCPVDGAGSSCKAEVKISAPAELKMHKSLIGKVSDYGVVGYRITAENLGGAAYTDAIVDDLTGNLAKAFYDGSRALATVDRIPRGSLRQAGNKLIWNDSGEVRLNPGETLTIFYEMRLNTKVVK